MSSDGFPNRPVQRTAASRPARKQIGRHERLAPVPDLLVEPQMQTPKPTPNCFLSGHVIAFQITALLLVSLAALLIVVSIGASRFKKVPASPIVFGHLAVPTS